MNHPPFGAPGVIVGAPSSGSGKTTVTLGILRALSRRGRSPGAFKVGPDYVDPLFLRAAAGRPALNLDAWAMRPAALAGLAAEAGRGAGLVVGEGVMGLFDGASDGTGSTADVAGLLGLPVVLVVDASGMGASAAALALGFIRHREDVDVAAVLFNRVGGPGHLDLLRRACDDHFSQPVLGGVPRDAGLALPSRHLGLVPAGELPDLEAFLERAADVAEAAVDLDRLERLARPPALHAPGPPPAPLPPLGQRIAVADDAAFAFAYPAVLDGWRRQGAEVAVFAPLADEAPADDADAVYLPGGYPELHAGRLAGNAGFQDGLRAAAGRGAFVYGECGGHMALGDGLIDADGARHRMAGLLPLVTSFAARRLHLGYRRLRLRTDSPLGAAGTGYAGHEFHYARETERAGDALFDATDARGRALPPAGVVRGRVAGSFVHLIDRRP